MGVETQFSNLLDWYNKKVMPFVARCKTVMDNLQEECVSEEQQIQQMEITCKILKNTIHIMKLQREKDFQTHCRSRNHSIRGTQKGDSSILDNTITSNLNRFTNTQRSSIPYGEAGAKLNNTIGQIIYENTDRPSNYDSTPVLKSQPQGAKKKLDSILTRTTTTKSFINPPERPRFNSGIDFKSLASNIELPSTSAKGRIANVRATVASPKLAKPAADSPTSDLDLTKKTISAGPMITVTSERGIRIKTIEPPQETNIRTSAIADKGTVRDLLGLKKGLSSQPQAEKPKFNKTNSLPKDGTDSPSKTKTLDSILKTNTRITSPGIASIQKPPRPALNKTKY